MTLQQLKYVVATAEKGTVSEAAQSLFISQPSLTNAIRELEKEMNITIFIRTNKGITVSKEGEAFWAMQGRCLNKRVCLKKILWKATRQKAVLHIHSALLLCGERFC